MPPKTAKRILKDSLKKLSTENFKDFVDTLLEYREEKEEPRVKLAMVEGKDRLDVANVIITTFTEKGALKVAEQILRDINCIQDADSLAREAGGGAPNPGAEAAREAGGGAPNPGAEAMEHFIDEHMEALIQRVSSVDPILDALLRKKILQAEEYDMIRAQPTPQKKMRELLTGPLKASRACKEELLSILRQQQPYLINDLEGN